MKIIIFLPLVLFFACADGRQVDLQQENEMLKSKIIDLENQTAPDKLQKEIEALKERNAILQTELDSCYHHYKNNF